MCKFNKLTLMSAFTLSNIKVAYLFPFKHKRDIPIS